MSEPGECVTCSVCRGDGTGAGGNSAGIAEAGSSDLMTVEDVEDLATKLASESLYNRYLEASGSVMKHIPPARHFKADKDAKNTADNDNASKPALSVELLADCCYNMSHPRRGRAVVINNANFEADTDMPKRLGTRIDVDGLGRALEGLGFLVQVFEDLQCERIKRLMRLLSKEDHSDADCLLVAVMTHGNDGEIYGTDGPLPTREITAPFRGDSCRSLIGKPKLFIFQACRGIMVDQGVVMDRHDIDEPDALIGYESARTIPIEADFLMACSSPEGYASWRNATSGAWFIQSLVRSVEAYGSSWEFTRILTLVNRMVALQYESLSENTFMTRKKQMPCFVSTLTKELYF